MVYTDFIAAIDLGTSHMVGMVGTKSSLGTLSILAYEIEKSENSMRRGCVYNVEDAAYKIGVLLRKLENKLDGAKIAKVYMGLGGQSIRTIEHTVSKILGAEVEVTPEVLNALNEECKSYHPSMLDVLSISEPIYYLDGKEEIDPLGITCSRIEARYKLVVGRPSLRRSVMKNIAERIKREVPSVLVSPVVLADLVLTEREKEQGCVLLDFGAGVTSVSVFKKGKLQLVSVIPFGGNAITRDLMSLKVDEKEAERLKRAYGDALLSREDDQQQMIDINCIDRQRRDIHLSDLNEIVEARSREILENVYVRLEDAGVTKEPGFTVVIAGGGSALKNIREAISSRFGMEVRYASIRRGLIDSGEMIANNPDYTLAAALLLAGKENCAYQQVIEPVVPQPAISQPTVHQSAPASVPEPEPEPVKEPEPEPIQESKSIAEPTLGLDIEPTVLISDSEKKKRRERIISEDEGSLTEERRTRNRKKDTKQTSGIFSFLDKIKEATRIDDNDY